MAEFRRKIVDNTKSITVVMENSDGTETKKILDYSCSLTDYNFTSKVIALSDEYDAMEKEGAKGFLQAAEKIKEIFELMAPGKWDEYLAFTQGNISAYLMIKNYLNIVDMQLQVPKVNPSHIASRLVTILVLQKAKVQISGKRCEELVTDLKEAKVDRQGSLDPWKNKNPDKSHALDAFRYFIFSNFAEITSNFNLEKYGTMLQ